MRPTREDWREHGDMAALVLRARTGYRLIRKPTPDPDREALVDLLWRDVRANGFSAKERAGHALDRLRQTGKL